AFGAIVHSVAGVGDLADSLRRFKLSGFDYGFVTDDIAPNEYDQSPAFFEVYLRDIHAPYFHPSTPVSLRENTVHNTPVIGLTAGDPDPGQTLTYAITGGNINGAFAINAATGQLTVANAAVLDFEQSPVFTLTVSVSDSSTLSLSDTVIQTITLVDQPDGTTGNDAFMLNYSANSVTITMSTNGGPTTSLGTFPLTAPLTLFGLGGTDSVKVVGTSGSDVIEVSNSGAVVNGGILILNSTESLSLVGGAGNDTYRFDTDTALGLISLDEVGGGIDMLDFSLTETVGISINLGLATTQVVNANLSLNLKSATTFENVIGGSRNDTLTGNSLNNVLIGDAGNDTYVFDTDTQLGLDNITDSDGIDTLSFATSANDVVVNLGLTTIAQIINTNLTLTLNSATSIENVRGGSGNDTLTGNSLNNVLIGGAGADSLIGGDGNDSLIIDNFDTSVNGGAGVDRVTFGGATQTSAISFNLVTSAIEAVTANASTFNNTLDATGAT
ncbi:MAG: hypothetical protein FJ267_12355, partial [Planctomycetes bacterium]|nr:hypothetical protein [Planctomycetota bacterium]